MKGNTTRAREAISDAYVFKEAPTSPNIFEANVLIDIYDGNYNEALSNLGSK
ncbi:MAG: hypothetical protein MZV63_51070 [Marinilabiliales bacterium]|nr:hypothetical protein [Marinilabiliales bacterium]